MKACIKTIFLSMMVLALLIGIQPVSYATPLGISLFDGTTMVTVYDGGGSDLDATDGSVAYIGAVGNWSVNITSAVTYPALGSTSAPVLDLNSLNITSTGGGTLQVSASALGYTFAPSGAIFNIGGTTIGTVEAEAYSGANSYFAQDNQLGSTLSFTPGAFSGSTSGGVPASPNPYSLSIFVDITHTGAGNSSFDAEARVIPEPATMLLLGSGLLGIGVFARRRFSKK